MNNTPSQAARRAGATGPEPVQSQISSAHSISAPPSPLADFNPDFTDKILLAALRPIAEKWFRLEVRGSEHIPDSGPGLVTANHSGAIALDALMTQLAVFDNHPRHRHVHMLAADLVFELPVVADIARAAGHAVANPNAAHRLLTSGHLVGVWPEGFAGVGKTWAKRYQLQQFAKGGFVVTAKLANSPIIPTAIVGAEEAYPMIADFTPLAKALKLPYFPITPTFPALGPLGLVPLPSKWIIQFGAPILPEELPDPYDEKAVLQKSQEIRLLIQDMVDALVADRGSAF